MAGQRNQVVKFGLKATFGEDARKWIGRTRKRSARDNPVDFAQRKNWRIAVQRGQVAVTTTEWYGHPPSCRCLENE